MFMNVITYFFKESSGIFTNLKHGCHSRTMTPSVGRTPIIAANGRSRRNAMNQLLFT